jgi:ParB family transcriptional regulator, chromosome partitioning protein
MFEASWPIDALRPADYNPRAIDEVALAKLGESIRDLGMVKPIVALRDGLIVAGHQRTRAARVAGVTHVPVCFLEKKPNPQDEIRFNQLHNGTDLDSGEEQAQVEPSTKTGYAMAKVVAGNHRAPGASIRTNIAQMLNAYGNWGGCVATLDGEVLTGASYALAANVIGMPSRVHYVDDALVAKVRDVFALAYGRYCYDGIERQTYNQTFAQLYRLRNADNPKQSPTYDWLLSETPKSARILDFGCGQGDYVRALKAKGYDIHGVELFRRKGNALDYAAIHGMIDKLILSLRAFGQWDVVICDYVLNSVDSQQAEDDVMACCSAFVKPGGKVYFSGRPISRVEQSARMSKRMTRHRECEFLDENNLSALFRGGDWFFQKFHRPEDIASIVKRHYRDDGEHVYRPGRSAWQASTIKAMVSPMAAEAIRREFDLPLPGGKRLGRHDDVLAAIARFI